MRGEDTTRAVFQQKLPPKLLLLIVLVLVIVIVAIESITSRSTSTITKKLIRLDPFDMSAELAQLFVGILRLAAHNRCSCFCLDANGLEPLIWRGREPIR